MNEAVSLTVVVTVDEASSQSLWQTGAQAEDLDLDGRFEQPDGGAYTHDGDPAWEKGRLMWCDSALEAKLLAAYERACGFASRQLWDLYPPEGDVVLSSRPWTAR